MSSLVLFVTVCVVFVAISASEHRPKCSFTEKDSTYRHFYPLTEIPDSKSNELNAKVSVSVSSDYGDVHILLSESVDTVEANRGYEFVSAPHEGGEIRRRNSVTGEYTVLAKTNLSVDDYAPGITTFEFVVSVDGEIKVSVTSPNSTIASYNEESVTIDKYRTPQSNYSFQAKDAQPFPVNFISFSGHSKLQFNCDYGVFVDKTQFIQTRCEGIYGWRQEELFHPLDSTNQFQPNGFYAKVDISMLSDYGNLHVILSETNEKINKNPCYEIVIADRFGTESEIRRKNSISQVNDFPGQFSFSYNIKHQRASLWMRISVSVDGVISFTDLHKNLTFNYSDTQPTIPVKYITFGGHRRWPATYEFDCTTAERKC